MIRARWLANRPALLRRIHEDPANGYRCLKVHIELVVVAVAELLTGC